MKKMIPLFLCISLVSLLFSTSVFAEPENREESVKGQIQTLLDEESINASVSCLGEDDAASFLNFLRTNFDISTLYSKLSKDGYDRSREGNITYEILENTSYNAALFAFEKFENNDGDTILVIHLYDEGTNTLQLTYAQKITARSEISDYFTYRVTQIPRTRAFNTVSFLCGLGGTVACGAFSAMLFAFVPASIAVGMTCSAAFAWVCGYA